MNFVQLSPLRGARTAVTTSLRASICYQTTWCSWRSRCMQLKRGHSRTFRRADDVAGLLYFVGSMVNLDGNTARHRQTHGFGKWQEAIYYNLKSSDVDDVERTYRETSFRAGALGWLRRWQMYAASNGDRPVVEAAAQIRSQNGLRNASEA